MREFHYFGLARVKQWSGLFYLVVIVMITPTPFHTLRSHQYNLSERKAA